MSKIEWTNETWNPLVGCSLQSPGCTNCYAMSMAYRLQAMGTPQYAGTAKKTKAGPVWTGKVNFVEGALLKPLSWKKPRLIFVNSMSDMFHPDVPFEWIDRIFAVMALCPQHKFQVLTKRSDRMREYCDSLTSASGCDRIMKESISVGGSASDAETIQFNLANDSCLPNVWLGVSVEDQKRADERIPDLLKTPAAKRFLSCEPLLGSVNLEKIYVPHTGQLDALTGGWSSWPAMLTIDQPFLHMTDDLPAIDWVIVGGESGKGARPMHPDWVRTIRDQCAAANVPFFFKQWGSWIPAEPSAQPPFWDFQDGRYVDGHQLPDIEQDRRWCEEWRNEEFEGHCIFERVGKKAAGRLLDGQEHNGKPEL